MFVKLFVITFMAMIMTFFRTWDVYTFTCVCVCVCECVCVCVCVCVLKTPCCIVVKCSPISGCSRFCLHIYLSL